MTLTSTRTAILALGLGSLLSLPAMAQKTDYPTAGFDAARTGNNPNETIINKTTVATLHQVWADNLDGSSVLSQPIVALNVATPTFALDLAYVGTEHGMTAALDVATGSVAWSNQTGFSHVACADLHNGDFGISAPAAYDRATNSLYMMGGDGKLYAYVAGTGTVVPGWPVAITTIPAVEHIYGGLNVANGNVYVTTSSMCDHGTYHGRVMAVSTSLAKVVSRLYIDGSTADANGNLTHAGTGGGGIFSVHGVTTDGGYVYVAAGNLNGAANESSAYGNHVLKMTPDLSVVASALPPVPCANCDLDLSSAPLLFQPAGCLPRLAVLSKTQNVFTYRRSPFTTAYLQKLPVKSMVGELAYDSASQNLIAANLDGVRAYNVRANCGAFQAWNTPMSGQNVVGAPAVANGIVFYGNGFGNTVYALDVTSGKVLWSHDVGSGVLTQPTIVNGTLLVTTWGGGVFAFRP